MTSRRWSTFVSVSVFALVLMTADSARAQWAFPAISGNGGVSQFGPGNGAIPGFSPFDYGAVSVGAAGCCGSSSIFIGLPAFNYAASTGQRALTTRSYQSLSDTVSLVPGWNGSGSVHRIRHRTTQTPPAPRRRVTQP
jgi:hypothetical protein